MILISTPSDATAFAHFVDDAVLAAVRASVTRFPELLQRLPSIFPAEVLSSIDRLRAARSIPATIADVLKLDASCSRSHQTVDYPFLPLPHPLDFEWRFTSRTARSLLELAATLTPRHGDISLFGTPGLASEVFFQPMTQRLRFVAEDNLVTRRFDRPPTQNRRANVHNLFQWKVAEGKCRYYTSRSTLVSRFHATNAGGGGGRMPSGRLDMHEPTT